MRWPTIETLASEHLRLDPLLVDHAREMVGVLASPSLYEYTGGEAPSLERLQRRYASQAVGRSQDGSEGWFNWIVRRVDDDAPIGFIQATIRQHAPDLVAEIAWVITPSQQGRGMASEAAMAMTTWLRSKGVSGFVAHVHPAHLASMGVARKVGLHPTPVLEDGEVRWES